MALLMRPEPLAADFDRLFNTLFDRNQVAQRWVPAMDLVEHDDHFLLRADLPGLAEEDVNIELNDGSLTIDGEQIKASFTNGVLEVWIPKPEERKPRKIEIGAGKPETIEAAASDR